MPIKFVHKCDKPLNVVNPRYRSHKWTEDSRYTQSLPDYKLQVPCGHCLTCRQKRSRSWQFRLIKEAEHTPKHRVKGKLSPRVLFCTFTFAEEPKVSTNKEERDILAPYIRDWRERWRKRFGVSPRYFAVSDIGTDGGRLHLHLLIFNPVTKDGIPISRSSIYRYNRTKGNTKPNPLNLNMYWKFGFVTYCEYLSGFEGIHYASGYMTCANAEKKAKKHNKVMCARARTHYASVFVSQGLGKNFIYTSDFASLRAMLASTAKLGKYTYAVPRYYKTYYFQDVAFSGGAFSFAGIECQNIVYLTKEEQMRSRSSWYVRELRDLYESARGRPPIHMGKSSYTNPSLYEKVKLDRLRLYYDTSFDYLPPAPTILRKMEGFGFMPITYRQGVLFN